MSYNTCSEFVNLLNLSIKSIDSNITYYNKNALEIKNCYSDQNYSEFTNKLKLQGIIIKSSNVLPKTEIGISYNQDTKTILVFPTSQIKISEK